MKVFKQYGEICRSMKVSIFMVAMLGCRAGGDVNSRNSGADSSTGTVEVSIEVSDESADEFRPGGDSVQIGGTNLAASESDETLVIYSLTPTGRIEVDRKQYKGNYLSFKIPAGQYYSFEVVGSKLAAVIPPSIGRSKVQARVSIDRTSTISSKIATMIAENASRGDKPSIDIIQSKTLAARDLYTLATAVKNSIVLKSPVTGQSGVLNLSKLAIDLASSVAAKAAVYPVDQFSRHISAAAFNGPLFSANGTKIRNDVAAFETANPGGSQPGRVTAIKYATDLNESAVISAFDALSTVVSSKTASDTTAFNQAVKVKFEENFSVIPAAEPPPIDLPASTVPPTTPGDEPSSPGSPPPKLPIPETVVE